MINRGLIVGEIELSGVIDGKRKSDYDKCRACYSEVLTK